MRRQVPEFAPSPVVTIERLREGRAQSLAEIATDTFYRWSVGGRVGRTGDVTGGRYNLFAGIEADGGGSRARDLYSGDVRELVDGVPARIWRFVNPGLESFRHEVGLAAFASARIRLARNLQLTGALRYDSVSGSAEGADAGIRWHTLLPRADARWTIGGSWRAGIFAGYTQSAYRLPLDWLAFGDPAAPTADVFRWDPVSTPGPRVARVGPGHGGDPGFSGIEPGLRPPRSDELVVGLDLQPASGLRLRLTGMTRKERDLVGLTNTGAIAFERSEIFDPGANVGSPDDDRLVPVHNRLPATFGLDRWLLRNLGGEDATFEGIELTVELMRSNATLLVGGTAGRSQVSGASRGFGPLENDQGLVGEIDADPNALTFARGRPFSDRAYTGKVVAVYRLPTRTTAGFIARYQDGQPFSRMLVVEHLNQGAEAIRAFASGDSRFMFIGTLDARLQQDVTRGSNRVQIVLDIYNLPGLSYAVEEQATQPPDVRITTAVQPPRTVHLGMRFAF
jgi:hypothetical protein